MAFPANETAKTQSVGDDAGAAVGLTAQREAWVTPAVIVSDMGAARGANVIPGADGSSSGYTYGS